MVLFSINTCWLVVIKIWSVLQHLLYVCQRTNRIFFLLSPKFRSMESFSPPRGNKGVRWLSRHSRLTGWIITYPSPFLFVFHDLGLFQVQDQALYSPNGLFQAQDQVHRTGPTSCSKVKFDKEAKRISLFIASEAPTQRTVTYFCDDESI